MSQQRDIERLLDQWFSDGPVRAPDRVLDVVADRIERQRQRPAWRLHRRFPPMVTNPRPSAISGRWTLLAGIAAVAAIAVAFLGLVGTSPTVQPTQPPSLGPSVPASSIPTARPTAAPSAPALSGSGLVVFEHLPNGQTPRLEYLLPNQIGQVLLPDQTGGQERPTWSADGRLAFAAFDPRDPTGAELIWETDATGATPRLLSTGCEPPTCLAEIDPAYSADTSKLALVRVIGPAGGPPTSMVIVVRDLQTGSAVELEATRVQVTAADGTETSYGHPTWSPDGASIAYHRILTGTDGAFDSDVIVVDSDGTAVRQLTPDDIPAGDPSWSPDGSLVLFASKPIHEWNCCNFSDRHIYTIAPDGSGLRQLDADGNVGAPTWASGGSEVLFISGRDVGGIGVQDFEVMHKDGSNVRRVARFNDCCHWYAVQQPTP